MVKSLEYSCSKILLICRVVNCSDTIYIVPIDGWTLGSA